MGKIVKRMSTFSEREGQDRRRDRRHQAMFILRNLTIVVAFLTMSMPAMATI